MSAEISEKVKILIVDDNKFFRSGLRLSIEQEDRFDVVGEAPDGDIAVKKVLELQPDIVLMDLNMPYMDGMQATQEIMRRAPETKIIILTALNERVEAIAAVRFGAHGYLYKDAITERYLIDGINAVARGGVLIDDDIMNFMREELRENRQAEYASNLDDLLESELELLKMIGIGMDNKEIGQRLQIANKTVSNRLSNLYNKLLVANRVEAAKYALRAGLVGLFDESFDDVSQQS